MQVLIDYSMYLAKMQDKISKFFHNSFSMSNNINNNNNNQNSEISTQPSVCKTAEDSLIIHITYLSYFSLKKSRRRKSIYNLTRKIDSLVILCGLKLPRAIMRETDFLCAVEWNSLSLQGLLRDVNRFISNSTAKEARRHVLSGTYSKHAKLRGAI